MYRTQTRKIGKDRRKKKPTENKFLLMTFPVSLPPVSLPPVSPKIQGYRSLCGRWVTTNNHYTQYTLYIYSSIFQLLEKVASCSHFLKLSQTTPFVKSVKGLLASFVVKALSPLQHAGPKICFGKLRTKLGYPQKPKLPFFSPISIWEFKSLNYSLLQGLLPMSGCSAEISKGNLDILEYVLGNTQWEILSHCFILLLLPEADPWPHASFGSLHVSQG